MVHPVAPPDVHVLDESYLGLLLPAEFEQRFQLIVVVAADDHAVELDRFKSGVSRGRDSLEHIGVTRAARKFRHPFGMEGIETDRDAPQPCLMQPGSFTSQQDTIGG